MTHLKKYRFFIAFFCVSIVFFYQASFAQKKINSLTEQDTTAINNAAKNTIKALFETLSFITDPTYSPDDKKIFMEKSFTTDDKIFFDRKRVQIEDDHNPHVTSHIEGVYPLQAVDYLNILSTSCKSESSDNVYTINWLSCVKSLGGRLIIKVRYSQTLPFVYNDSATIKYTKVEREADLFAQKVDKKIWKTYINSIYFFDTGNVANDNQNCIAITNSLEASINETVSNTPVSEDYYKYLIYKGTKAIIAKNYEEAYIALKKASIAPQFTKQAKDLISNRLYITMTKNGIENQDNYLSDKLQKQAQDYEEAYKYNDALQYYTYAFALSPANIGLSNRIADLIEKSDNQNKINVLYNNGLYQQAIDEYSNAIKDIDNKKNPFLYIGLAKSYAKLYDYKNAALNFKRAIKLDASLQEIYEAQGIYYKEKQNPNYQKAYEAYVNVLKNIPDKDDPYIAIINGEMTYCLGIELFNKKVFFYAADSFRSAIKYNQNHKEAFLMLGRCQNEMNKPVEAIENFKNAIKIDNHFGEAYYWLGITYWTSTLTAINKDYSSLAIKNLRQAVAIDNANGLWNLDLGMRLIKHRTIDSTTDKFYPEAIDCFTKCIQFDSLISQQALIFRGECYYALGKYQLANEDFKNVDTTCLSNILFYNDLGFMNLKSGKNLQATYCFSKNVGNNAVAMLGMGEAIYLNNIANPNKEEYLIWFKKAFNNGISHTFVNADATIALMTKKEKSFKKLRKTYGY